MDLELGQVLLPLLVELMRDLILATALAIRVVWGKHLGAVEVDFGALLLDQV